MTEQLIGQLGCLGIALILVLGGLGLPIPEEAPIVLAAVLSRNGRRWAALTHAQRLTICFSSSLVGVSADHRSVHRLLNPSPAETRR